MVKRSFKNFPPSQYHYAKRQVGTKNKYKQKRKQTKTNKKQRFLSILRYLHCSDTFVQIEQGKTKNPDKLFKIRTFMDSLVTTFRLRYSPSRFLSVDEMMIKFEGRCSFIQYQPRKPINRGFKGWGLSDHSNGYIVNLDVYCGASQRNPEQSVGEEIVLRLMEPYTSMGYSVTMDRYFSSPKLFETLLDNGIYATGTVNPNRKGFPDISLQKKSERGDSAWLMKESVLAGWI